MFTAAATVPLAAFTQNKKSTAREGKGFKIDNSKDRFGKSISLFEGDIFDCKVSAKDTDGDIYAFESRRIKKGRPPLHYHYEQDEWFYILLGEFLFNHWHIFFAVLNNYPNIYCHQHSCHWQY